jgi:hypothetical protein
MILRYKLNWLIALTAFAKPIHQRKQKDVPIAVECAA